MSTKITPKQRKFADKYLETGNGRLAAKAAYNITTDNSAGAVASENLTKPNVREYIEDKASKAAEIVFEIAQFGENDSVKLSASKDILDRAGLKPIEKSINLNLNETRDSRLDTIIAQIEQQLDEPEGTTISE